jgi:hypothetical protein
MPTSHVRQRQLSAPWPVMMMRSTWCAEVSHVTPTLLLRRAPWHECVTCMLRCVVYVQACHHVLRWDWVSGTALLPQCGGDACAPCAQSAFEEGSTESERVW